MGYDSWATWYDAVYSQSSLGSAYTSLTARHLEVLVPLCSAGQDGFLDVGAGTGRLSVPIAAKGILVTAVEPSKGMVNELRANASRAGVADRINVIEACAQSVPPQSIYRKHDVAACLFSTIHHVLEETDLERSLAMMASAVRNGGTVLIGVHPPELFDAFRKPIEHRLQRPTQGQPHSWSQVAEAVPQGDQRLDILCTLTFDNGRVVKDRLRLRTWTVEQIVSAAKQCGLASEAELSRIGQELLLRFRHDAGTRLAGSSAAGLR